MIDDDNNEISLENRTCEANNNLTIPMVSYDFTKVTASENSCEDKKDVQCKMLSNIRSLCFSIVELAEYLDTHPDDKKALSLHKEYSNKVNDLKDKYQRLYGPLTITCPCNKWRWLESPWPWERGNC